jgi:hypothetical protein
MINENPLQRKYWDIEIENKEINEALRQSLYQGGKKHETHLNEKHFSNLHSEVKTETSDAYKQYGNTFIEIETKIKGTIHWRESGLSVTKAEYWLCSVEDENGVILPISVNISVEQLKRVIERGLEEKWVKFQRNNKLSTGDLTNGYLVPMIRLLEPLLLPTSQYTMELFLKDYYRHRENLIPTEEDKRNRLKQLHNEKGKNR